MLRVEPPPPPLPDPLQPAIPAATQASSTSPAAAYPIRLPIDNRRCNASKAISSKDTMPSGNTGICGRMRVRGCVNGINSDSVVLSVAVQKALPVLEAIPEVGVQLTAAPRLLAPFLNCTVPVGPAPLLLVLTVAVSVTLPPDTMLVGLAMTEVVVVAWVTVTATLLLGDVLELKLLVASAVYVALRLYEPGVS